MIETTSKRASGPMIDPHEQSPVGDADRGINREEGLSEAEPARDHPRPLSHTGSPTSSQASIRKRESGWPNQRTLLLYLLGGLLIAAIPVGLSRFIDQPPAQTHTIDIPPGTAERLAAGDDVEIIPDELRFKLRDVLIIVNRDSVTHTIGPFEVEPGQTLERTFGEAAAFNSYCSLHPAGSISISISDG